MLTEVVRPNKYRNNPSIRLQSFPSKSLAIHYPILIIRRYIIRISDTVEKLTKFTTEKQHLYRTLILVYITFGTTLYYSLTNVEFFKY
jgi:hypothetical protein